MKQATHRGREIGHGVQRSWCAEPGTLQAWFAGVRASISLEDKSFAPELCAAVLSSDGSNSTRSRRPVPA
jgi:hypothetical protein